MGIFVPALPVIDMLDPHARILSAHGSDHQIVVVSSGIPIKIGGAWFTIAADASVDVSGDLDTGSLAAGTDYYVYACYSAGDITFKVSATSTFPSGFDADTSRKLGGVHTLCADVGTISGHDLSGYLNKDILPASIWDLRHRPKAEPAGMAYSDLAGIWVDIYLASGTGASIASVNGGTISDTRNWMDFVDDFASVKKQLLSDVEFQIIAAGSNEETNIVGSADPVTTGGHSDTAGRRMISNIGCEDCCGAIWQWLRDQSYRFDGAANHTHQVTVSGDPETVASGNPSGDVAPAFVYHNLPGSKGSLYRQGAYGDIKLRAGGVWDYGASCGSRSRFAASYRWDAASYLGGRGRSEPL